MSKKPKHLTPTERLARIAEILKEHDHWLLSVDGAVTQEPSYLRDIYLLTKREIGPRRRK